MVEKYTGLVEDGREVYRVKLRMVEKYTELG